MQYYIPISSQSLAHYWASACIKAVKYISNRGKDIQNVFEDSILLTDRLMKINDSDCCMQVVLTKDEINSLFRISDEYYLYQKSPLPITRVKKIYFNNLEQLATTITSINMSAAFIPRELCGVADMDLLDTNNITIEKDRAHYDAIEDQTAKIKQYDQFLGALALMKIVHDEDMNFSINYIDTLSFFNRLIRQQLESSRKRELNSSLQSIFVKNGSFDKILKYLDKDNISEDDVDRIAIEEGTKLKRNRITGTIDIDGIDENKSFVYTLAILYEYGVGLESKRKKIDSLILSRFNGLKKGKGEGVAMCYGYNRGYSVFNNKYLYPEQCINVKYEMTSQLDYYTIESVYQYVFNHSIQNYNFAYLDDWCPKCLTSSTCKRNEYKILDTIVIEHKVRMFSLEWWFSFIKKNENLFGLFTNIIFDKLRPQFEEFYNDEVEYMKDDVRKEIREEVKEEVRKELLEKEYVRKIDVKDNVGIKKQQEDGEQILVQEEGVSYNGQSLLFDDDKQITAFIKECVDKFSLSKSEMENFIIEHKITHEKSGTKTDMLKVIMRYYFSQYFKH